MQKVTIDKLTISGQGQGEVDGKIVLAWNSLPGETVEVEEYRKKGGKIEGVAKKILKPSPDRIEPKEPEHFISCSPWQIITWEKENEWKKKIATQVFTEAGVTLPKEPLEIITDGDKQYHYRNKMEYSFALNEIGDIDLAFFERGRSILTPIGSCHLANPNINKTASNIIDWLNNQPIPEESCKSLIIRSSNQGHTIAALFITEYFQFPGLPNLSESFIGFHIYYSRPESPASTPDKLIYSEGQDWLEEEVRETKLRYGLLSFFQVNVPVFIKAQDEIANWVSDKDTLVDFYSGVGAISLPLKEKYRKCVLVDESMESYKLARNNIYLNKIKNAKVIHSRSENITELIKKEGVIIFDPPRPGLHNKIINKILSEKPKRIIYLSCNVASQAYDINLLKDLFQIKFIRLYNFFPRTPHIESLVVLDRI